MGESVTDMLQFLCRLCARTDKSCVDVFSSDGDKFFIQKKIRLCLPVIVEEQDEMPRQICLSCLNKLESTYEFYTTCIYAQSTIQRLLKAKSLHDGDHVNKPGSEMKENVPISFSLDQYLKRKIDPVQTGRSSKVQRTDRLGKDLSNDNVQAETTESASTEVGTAGGYGNGSIVATGSSESQCVVRAGGSGSTPLVATNNSSATPAETQKPKLRVKTTSELRQVGQTSTVTDCVSALLSLQTSLPQPVAAPNTRQSTCVSASYSTSVVFSQPAVPQCSRATSSFPQRVKNCVPHRVKNSTALNSGASRVQNTKNVSSVVQFSKNSSALQSIGSSPSVLRFGTNSSALQTATSSLSAPQNATAILPMPKNATAPLTVPKDATVSLSVPQSVTNSSTVQHYSLSVPTSLSSGCKILPNVSQFIIVPNTFASTPTFTAAGTNTVTLLAQALPPNVSLVGDLSVPPGSATTLVASQSAQPSLPVSVQPLTISTTPALPLASSSLPLVQTVPLQVTQQLSNPVMTPLTSAPAVISQSSTSGTVKFSVLNTNSQEIVITTNSRVTASTSTASVFSKADSLRSKLSQNSKLSSSSVGSTSNAPAMRISAEVTNVGSRSDVAVRGVCNAVSTVSSKQNGGPQSRTNVTVSRAVSHSIILPKPAATVVTGAKNTPSNSSPLLRSHLVYSGPSSNKSSLGKPAKTSSQGSSSQNSDMQTTVFSYSIQSTAKANCFPTDKRTKAPTPVSLPQATVVTPVSSAKPTLSVSVGSTEKVKEGLRSIIIQKVNNKQLLAAGAVSKAKTEPQLSENRTQLKPAVPRPQPSGGLPPPPPTVPLNSVNISENRRKLTNSESADLHNGETTSPSSGHQVSREKSQKQTVKNVDMPPKNCVSNQASESERTPKARGPVATATVKPFTPTSQPASNPRGQSPGPSPEQEVECVTPPSDPPPSASRGRCSTSSSPAAEVGKEECPYCHVEFPADLLIHHKTLHYREKFYSCIDCDKNFVTEKGLESHRCQKESKG